MAIRVIRQEGQTWEQAYKADQRFWRLSRGERRKLIAWARKQDMQPDEFALAPEIPTSPPETEFLVPDGMTPEEATREKIKRDAELYPVKIIPRATDLLSLPVHELAKLETFMIPPSRQQEVRRYRDSIRRKAIADTDAKAAANSRQISRPGERWPDPRGCWSKGGQVRTGESSKPLSASSDTRAASGIPGIKDCIEEANAMDASQLQERLLSEDFHALPEKLRQAICDRYLMLEGIATESFWQALEKL